MFTKSYQIVVCTVLILCATLTQAAEEEAGPYTFEAMYRLDYWTGVTGPLKKQVDNVGLLDLRFAVDGEKAWNWKGGRIFVQAQGTHGSHPSNVQVTVQGIDNAEVKENTTRIMQAWVEQSFMKDKFSILFGLLDLNSEFYVTESSGTLLHPTFGVGSDFSQSGRNGPSIFPESSLALRAAWKFNEKVTWRTALFDAVPGDPAQPRGTHIVLDKDDGTLLVTELSHSNKTNENDANKLAIGAWRYSALFDDKFDTNGIDGAGNPIPVQSQNYGMYLFGERTLWRANEDGSRGIDAFFRIGWASPHVNQMDSAIGTGLLWRGPFASRPKDKFTLGIAAEKNTQKWRDAKVAAAEDDPLGEVAYEISYRAVVKDWFAAQADAQLVRNHSSQAPDKDAILVGVRLDFTY